MQVDPVCIVWHCFGTPCTIEAVIFKTQIFGRQFPNRFALCYWTIVLSVCPVWTLVHCGQTVGWIKMKLEMQVGLGPGDTVLEGDPAPPPPKRAQPPIFGPYLLRPNGWMDQDATWYGGRPLPRRFCVGWGPRLPSPKGSGAPRCSAHVYCGHSAGWIKMALGMEVGLSPGNCVRAQPPSQFSAHFYCGQTAGCIKMPVVVEVGLSPGNFVLGRERDPKKGGGARPVIGQCLLRPNGCMDQDAIWYRGRPRPR